LVFFSKNTDFLSCSNFSSGLDVFPLFGHYFLANPTPSTGDFGEFGSYGSAELEKFWS
jgi:hypothetical protein